MDKYLLKSERDRIHSLVSILANKLNLPENKINIKDQFYHLIKENKDSSIIDLLNDYLDSFCLKMGTLLQEKITPAIQFGIQNEYFSVIGYGGKYNGYEHEADINENTFFSFDSISKLLTSVLMMQEVREKRASICTSVHHYNPDFSLNASIESILKFTALIRTEKRIDNLSKEETINILKKVKEDLSLKSEYKNFYEYNDIGYMILRLSTNDFLKKLDSLLSMIDPINLTYDWKKAKENITGGKIGEEFITPDLKGRDILFPGHTGLYGNIDGLLQLFYKILYTEDILTSLEKKILFEQPYLDPTVYTKDGTQLIGKNQSPQYMAKISGIYRKPTGINSNSYDKMASCDMSNLTTDFSKASTGTCGSWVMGDDLSIQNKFGTYIGGLLTNPYSYILPGNYPESKNLIPNTNLTVNQKGVILGYQSKLNSYKEIITDYGLLLELITEYIKETDSTVLSNNNYQRIKKVRLER